MEFVHCTTSDKFKAISDEGILRCSEDDGLIWTQWSLGYRTCCSKGYGDSRVVVDAYALISSLASTGERSFALYLKDIEHGVRHRFVNLLLTPMSRLDEALRKWPTGDRMTVGFGRSHGHMVYPDIALVSEKMLGRDIRYQLDSAGGCLQSDHLHVAIFMNLVKVEPTLRSIEKKREVQKKLKNFYEKPAVKSWLQKRDQGEANAIVQPTLRYMTDAQREEWISRVISRVSYSPFLEGFKTTWKDTVQDTELLKELPTTFDDAFDEFD